MLGVHVAEPRTVHTTADTVAYWTPTPADLPNVPAVAEHYWESVNSPQRAWAVHGVAAFLKAGPVRSVLDVGCQAGPTLRALRRAWPGMTLEGLDVNAAAMAEGRRLSHLERGSEITYTVGSVPAALETRAPSSVDLVLSTYVLAYQSPTDIARALRACLRACRLGLVLIEPMADAQHRPDELWADDSAYVEWRHDYLAALDMALAEPWEEGPVGLRIVWVPAPQPVDRLSAMLLVSKERV